MTVDPTGLGRAIEIVDVGHAFLSNTGKNVTALLPTSLTVRPGEFLCLVGPSGCGKTTLLNLAAGLMAPTSGKITLDGKAPRMGDFDVGYLMARDSLFPWRTALENVMLPLIIRHVPIAQATEQAMKILTMVGLGDFANSYPSQLSHGMRQRTALARTLVVEPKTLFMDEPFSALDAETRLQLQQKFLELWEQHQSTVLFVTHDLAEAIALADRIAVFSARPGRIKQLFDIDLPRPRKLLDLQGQKSYHELFQEIWQTFRVEVKV